MILEYIFLALCIYSFLKPVHCIDTTIMFKYSYNVQKMLVITVN